MPHSFPSALHRQLVNVMDVSEPTVPGKRFDFAIPFRLSSALQSQVGEAVSCESI